MAVVLSILLLCVLLLFGVPFWVAMGLGTVTMLASTGVLPLTLVGEALFDGVDSFALIAIPLFILTGDAMVRSGLGVKLLNFAEASFGSFRSGFGTSTVMGCGLFSCISGSDAADAAAVGRLTMDRLVEKGYPKAYACALVASGACTGILIPPSIAYIILGLVLGISSATLFQAAFVPGVMVLLAVMLTNAIVNRVRGYERSIGCFDFARWRAALWDAKWEMLLPVVIVGALFSGFATTVEASAIGALYAFFTQVVIHRDLKIGRDIGRVAAECSSTVGGVLLILGVAVGLTSWMIDADVPGRLLELTQQYIHSQWTFLLALNLFLLVVGMLMDIFSATFVVAPLLVPLGLAYEVHPVHLGIIFIANLELGYLTPPVGLNLFLSSYRFRKPLLEVAAASFPMLLVLGFGVLVITYVPWLTTGLLAWMGRI